MNLCRISIRYIWIYDDIDVSRIIVFVSLLCNIFDKVGEKIIIDKNVV